MFDLNKLSTVESDSSYYNMSYNMYDINYDMSSDYAQILD